MKTVCMTQYMQPDGRKKQVSVDLPDEVAEMAKGLDLSCELMPNDPEQVVLYAKPTGADPDDYVDGGKLVERSEIADNGPGENSPLKALERLIRRVHEEESDGRDHVGKSNGPARRAEGEEAGA